MSLIPKPPSTATSITCKQLEALEISILEIKELKKKPDIWSRDIFVSGGTIQNVTQRWVGTVPKNFSVNGIRLSVNTNNGISIYFKMTIGQGDATLAIINWPYVLNQDSIYIPYSAWTGNTLLNNILPVGARIECEVQLSGSGEAFGLSADFIGKWLP